MRKVLGIASVFIMMLSVAAFANTFAVEETVLAAGAVDVEECGDVTLTYDVENEEDGDVEKVFVDEAGDPRPCIDSDSVDTVVAVQLYDDDETLIGTGRVVSGEADPVEVPITAAGEQEPTVENVERVNVQIYDAENPPED